MNRIKRIMPWLTIPGLLLAALLALLFLGEWYTIGVTADPATIESYHFGSEAMVGHGGQRYQSATTYAQTALVTGIAALAIAGVFIAALLRRSSPTMLTAYGLLILGIILNQVLM